MKKEIKLGVGVAILCLCLFLLVIVIGNWREDVNHAENSQGKETENINDMNTESEDTQDIEDTQNTEDTQNVENTQNQNSEMNSTETESPEENDTQVEEEDEYVNFAIANVRNYVNVRKGPNTDSDIVGKIYNGAVAQILNTVGEGEEQWFQITSGNVEGYIKAEYFIHGEEAASVMDQYVSKYIKVNVKRLNVRKKATTDSARTGYINSGEVLKVVEIKGDWIKVQYTPEVTGYVAAKYVTVTEEYSYAKSSEDEKKEKAFIKELEDRAGLNKEENNSNNNNNANNNSSSKEDTTETYKPPSETYTSNEELRKAIIEYAMQFLGDKYVHGGQSLKTGTDCSGFTMYVLREFGISISRTPQGQYTSAGRKISYSEIQPGDIICYSGNGGKSCTHVAFYIGDGKILHAANKRDGVKISSATNSKIIGVRNVID